MKSKTTKSIWTKRNLFDPTTIRKSMDISFKDKLRLLLRRSKYSFDTSDDGNALTRYKIIDKTAYILDVKYTPLKKPKTKEKND